MSMRTHIAFFGCRNAGKSSLVNAITDQELSVVSDILGTTTDPVYKTMELLPIGPVMIIDTPGYDDDSILGEKRIEKTKEVLRKTDIAILVIDGLKGMNEKDKELLSLIQDRPHIIVYTKKDLVNKTDAHFYVSSYTKENIQELKEKIGALNVKEERYMVADLLKDHATVILVIPIDESAPKGRLILPQQMVIRELLDYHMIPVLTQVEELENILKMMTPDLVITDSQAFEDVFKIVPAEILLTSFSLLMSRMKGTLEDSLNAIKAIETIKDNDKILISEGCTHHRQCKDIGTVKIPNWLKTYTHKSIIIETTSGRTFKDDLKDYKCIIHCGGCMLNDKEMMYRNTHAKEENVPMINYGMFIAYINGILERSIQIFEGHYDK